MTEEDDDGRESDTRLREIHVCVTVIPVHPPLSPCFPSSPVATAAVAGQRVLKREKESGKDRRQETNG